MAVTAADVRRAAALARLSSIDDARAAVLAVELSAVTARFDALRHPRSDGDEAAGVGAGGTPLRADAGPPYALAHPVEQFAPAVRDGYVVAPPPDGRADAAGAGLTAPGPPASNGA